MHEDKVFKSYVQLRTKPMCRKVNQTTTEKKTCNMNHETQYAPCAKTGLYIILPYPAGNSILARRASALMTKHAASVKTTAAGNLSAHCQAWKCRLVLKKISVLARNKNLYAREMLEALTIEEKAEECVSNTSIAFKDMEKQYSMLCFRPSWSVVNVQVDYL